MPSLRFEWDPKKDTANQQKHGISFEAATVTFQDPLAALHVDPDHSNDEKREILVGHDTLGRLLLVVFTERQGKIRIITARRATKRERQAYEASQKKSP
jgi:uncharacterized DUF497 family protein